jgi:hypothetical protein
VLFVIDNSFSMQDEQQSVAESFARFVDDLPAGADLQVGVVTTEVYVEGNGNQGSLRSEAPIGSGSGCSTPRIVRLDDADPVAAFESLAMVGADGSGTENGLLAAALTLCKSQPESFWIGLDDRSADDPIRSICSRVPAVDRASGDAFPCNADAAGPFVRNDASTHVVVVSDEGDAEAFSSLVPQHLVEICLEAGASDPSVTQCTCRIDWFGAFFSGLPRPATLHTIGPTHQLTTVPTPWCDDTEVTIAGPCNGGGSSTCSIDHYQRTACLTGGTFHPIEENRAAEGVQCEAADFDEVLGDIAASLGG